MSTFQEKKEILLFIIWEKYDVYMLYLVYKLHNRVVQQHSVQNFWKKKLINK